MRDKAEIIDVICPRCRRTAKVYLPPKGLPRCQVCDVQMVLKELLDKKICA